MGSPQYDLRDQNLMGSPQYDLRDWSGAPVPKPRLGVPSAFWMVAILRLTTECRGGPQLCGGRILFQTRYT